MPFKPGDEVGPVCITPHDGGFTAGLIQQAFYVGDALPFIPRGIGGVEANEALQQFHRWRQHAGAVTGRGN